MKGHVFDSKDPQTESLAEAKRRFDDLRGIKSKPNRVLDIPISLAVTGNYDDTGVVRRIGLRNCRVDESNSGNAFRYFAVILYPALFERLLIVGNDLVLVLVRKQVRAHRLTCAL